MITPTIIASRPLSRVPKRSTDWLFFPLIPLGNVTIVAGNGGVGKSTFIYDIIARVTTGDAMPTFGGRHARYRFKRSAIILTKEDDMGMVRQRLEAAGADVSRVYQLETRSVLNPKDYDLVGRLDERESEIERHIDEIGDVRLILVDPITDYAGDLNMSRETHVRRLLTPWVKIARDRGIAVICVAHLVKDEKRSARNRISGSMAFGNISRSVLLVGAATGNRRLIMLNKWTFLPEPKVAAFSLVDCNGSPRIEWEPELQDAVDQQQVLMGRDLPQTKQQRAAMSLKQRLINAPMRADEAEAFAEGLDIHLNTLKAAKREIGAISKRRDDEWWWSLPIKRTRIQR